MKTRKRMLTVIALILALLLCSCGQSGAPEPRPDPAPGSEAASQPAAAVPEPSAPAEASSAATEASIEPESADPSETQDAVCAFTPQRHRISAGAYTTAVLLDSGTVSTTWDNSMSAYIDVHDEWADWSDIVDIDIFCETLVALKSNGTVLWCGGRTDESWWTEPDIMDCVDSWTDMVQVSAGIFCIGGLRADGSVEVAGRFDTLYLEETDGFTQISIADAFLGLRTDGTVYCFCPFTRDTFAYDTSGWSDIIQVSAGWDHAVALRGDGTVVATGNNSCGQCDVDGWTDIVQVCAGREHTFGLKSDGTVVAAGTSSIDGAPEFAAVGWTDVVELSGRYNHTAGITSDGTILFCGLESPSAFNAPCSSIHD